MRWDRAWTGLLWYVVGAVAGLALGVCGYYPAALVTAVVSGLVAWRWIRQWPVTASLVLWWQLTCLRQSGATRMRAPHAWWTRRYDFREPQMRSKSQR